MPDFLAQILGQFRAVWGQLAAGQRVVICSVLVAVAVLLGALVWFGGRTDLAPLASGLSGEELKKVTGILEEKAVPYEFRSDGTLLVPSAKLSSLRAELAMQGVGRAGQGWDLLDKMSMTAPRFLYNHTLLRARCEVLAESIATIEGVKEAKVIATVPKQALFTESEKEARVKASVFIRLRDGLNLQNYVPGIVNMVSSAIERLEPENVRIMDSATGRSYTIDAPSEESFTAGLDEAQRRAELLERRAQEFLDRSFGPGKTAVMVHVEIDLQRTETKVESKDPESKVVLRERSTSSTSDGGPAGGGGGPGVANAVQGVATQGGARKDQSEKEKDYDFTKTTTLTRDPGGRITRVTASVQVDETLKEAAQKVKDLVATALGIDEKNKNRDVTVLDVPFQRPEVEEVASGGLSLERFLAPGAQILGALLVLFFLRGLLKRGGPPLPAAPPARLPALPQEGEKEPDPAQERKRLRREIELSVAGDPGAVGRLLAGWLQER